VSELMGPELPSDSLWLRIDHRDARGGYSYSLDGITFVSMGDRGHAFRSFWYEGTKVGLFCYDLSTGAGGGYAEFDFFRQEHDGPRRPVCE
jgi:Beta xylosidase C-terminal Concanavalin A-like domain